MRVLFVCSVYLPNTGGVETMIEQLGRHLTALGHQPSVLTKRWPASMPAVEDVHGIPVHRVDNAVLPTEFRHLVQPVTTLLSATPPDLVHVIGVRRPLPAIALMISRLTGAPLLATVAGGDVPDPVDPEPGKVWRTGSEFVPDALLQADAVTAVSADVAKLTTTVLPDLPLIPVRYAGIDVDYFASAPPYPHPRPYLLSLRRLEPSKGVEHLLHAFGLLARQHPELDLMIAGDGPERNRLESLARDTGLTRRVRFLGEVPLQTAACLLRGAVLTVVPSLSEGGGLVNVEAQAAGCPVVATDVGGIREYLRGAAHFVRSADATLLAEGIDKIITDDGYRDMLIQAGMRNAALLDWSKLTHDYLGDYQVLRDTATKAPFRPWSALTKLLWDELTDRRLPRDAEWEGQRSKQEQLLADAPEGFFDLGPSGRRWYYSGVLAGQRRRQLNATARWAQDLALDRGPTLVASALAEAAEWGRFDPAGVGAYLAQARDGPQGLPVS